MAVGPVLATRAKPRIPLKDNSGRIWFPFKLEVRGGTQGFRVVGEVGRYDPPVTPVASRDGTIGDGPAHPVGRLANK